MDDLDKDYNEVMELLLSIKGTKEHLDKTKNELIEHYKTETCNDDLKK